MIALRMPVSCETVRDLLFDYEHGWLDAPVQLDVEEHLGQCTNCRAFHETERALSAQLASEGGDVERVHVPRYFTDGLMADLPTQAHREPPIWRRWPVIAGVGAGLIVAGAWVAARSEVLMQSYQRQSMSFARWTLALGTGHGPHMVLGSPILWMAFGATVLVTALYVYRRQWRAA